MYCICDGCIYYYINEFMYYTRRSNSECLLTRDDRLTDGLNTGTIAVVITHARPTAEMPEPCSARDRTSYFVRATSDREPATSVDHCYTMTPNTVYLGTFYPPRWQIPREKKAIPNDTKYYNDNILLQQHQRTAVFISPAYVCNICSAIKGKKSTFPSGRDAIRRDFISPSPISCRFLHVITCTVRTTQAFAT